jgi:hypothetical protein
MFVFTQNDKVVSFVYFEGANHSKNDFVFGGAFLKRFTHPKAPYYTSNDYIFVKKGCFINGGYRFTLFDQQALKSSTPSPNQKLIYTLPK